MDDEQIRNNEVAARKLAASRIKTGIQYMMGNRAGRALMWHLLEQYGVFHEGFSDNALVMARSSGRRSAGLEMLHLIDAYSPEKYSQMVEEAREDAITNSPMGEE